MWHICCERGGFTGGTDIMTDLNRWNTIRGYHNPNNYEFFTWTHSEKVDVGHTLTAETNQLCAGLHYCETLDEVFCFRVGDILCEVEIENGNFQGGLDTFYFYTRGKGACTNRTPIRLYRINWAQIDKDFNLNGNSCDRMEQFNRMGWTGQDIFDKYCTLIKE